MQPFIEALNQRVLVCDGAMGTMLYSKGVFINKSFDALNLSRPELVEEVHQDYVRAGADIVETNTFGANRIKLGSFGLGESLVAINVEGVRIARRAAGERAYVAGSIGPLGIRIEPWGKTGVEEAQEYFAEQTKEYPLAAGVATDPALVPLDEIGTPEIDLSDLADLEGTLELLQEVGIL